MSDSVGNTSARESATTPEEPDSKRPRLEDAASAEAEASKNKGSGEAHVASATGEQTVLLEGQLWPLGSWSCPACTLVNLPAAERCGACDGNRPGDSKSKADACSRVVVVLPPTQENPEEGAEHAAAATARHAAIVAAARGAQPVSTKEVQKADGAKTEEPGVAESLPWRGLGPDGEWIAGPASEQQLRRPRAKDTELDIFADLAAATEDAIPDVDAPIEEAPPNEKEKEPLSDVIESLPPISSLKDGLAHGKDTLSEEKPLVVEIKMNEDPVLVEGPLREGEANDTILPSVVEADRPAWGVGTGPLFSNLDETLPIVPGSGIDDLVLLEDSVSRLSSLGYNPRRCRLALEAAMGDENLAHSFLAGEI
eukprot:gnl/MRDRNA2_/MRDRNA2_30821_c0_seq1.p1 gnl/MRDRNA2_/MRDRNA2_30821_c0~~gnl/MRDRNA2_/MRDRNA2_30821_c0_seq1.p1  ORF type:complete len:368 (+),score=99.06 gnl/MRDRNA2_/MRDRNA2_30821_c0_seq1:116-1219(+)